ncbi:nitroreductase family protein [Salinibacterium sp.]|uniref:nitroreductase family protein n=1 Tax=Salinibacterium sp. TaxID=1915057 RepID=UPI00286AAE4A|nr:nitroreductase family protein [Salinibacterium sp.]
MSALDAVLRRQSYPQVTAEAPTHAELAPIVEAAATIADHGSLKPWRLIELRGDDRVRLGTAFAKEGGSADKPLRAPLLIAVVAVNRSRSKIPEWEQDAVASGVAYMLSLMLDDAGWGVFWRTGELTRHKRVAKMHGLGKHEKLMGWLYVGGKPEKSKAPRKRKLRVESYLSAP